MGSPHEDHGRPRRGRPEDWEAPGAALVRSAATDRIPALADLGRMHIMGIAGSGMSALARILFDRGVPGSGREARESITVAGLLSGPCGNSLIVICRCAVARRVVAP